MAVHPVEGLFEAISEVEPYPLGVVPLPERLHGTAFFPGGAGLWFPEGATTLPPFPVGGVMVLGHDFHSEAAFERSRRIGAEVVRRGNGEYRMGPTWKNLRYLLARVGISESSCFFTNGYMGLREGRKTVGEFPGSSDVEFVRRCREFLGRQLSAQRPRVILTLGAWVPSLIAPLSPELCGWLNVRSFDQLDSVGPVIHEATIPDSLLEGVSVVALTHPSFRALNVERRRYHELRGDAAELAMLQAAIDHTALLGAE